MAYSALEYKDYKKVIYHLDQYLEKFPEKQKERFLLAEAYRNYRDYDQALAQYQKIADQEHSKFLLADFYRATLLQAKGKCEEAIPVYEQFRKDYRGEKDDRKYLRLAKNQLAACEGEMLQIPQEETRIKEMNSSINGGHMEGSPLFLDAQRLVYNSLKIQTDQQFAIDEDSLPQRKFYLASKEQDGHWNNREEWTKKLQVSGYQLASAAYNKDKTRLYFSACKTGATGKLDCDLFVFDENQNSVEKLPKEINSKFRESQPAIGIDDKGRDLIYFVSDRKEGKGGMDVWYSRYDPKKNTYKEARNAGSKINSVGNEMTPFVNPRNNKFYFSSDGHPGFGNLDVFVASGERSKWTEPQNLGRMINSGADELYFTESPNGLEGVFASNRSASKKLGDSQCCDDLFLYQYLDKILVSVSGSIINQEKKGESIADALILIYAADPPSGEMILEQRIKSNSLGEYKAMLEPNTNYRMVVQKEGYFQEEKELKTNQKSQSLKNNLLLKPMSKESIVIENIYYKFDQSELTESALTTIDTTILPIMLNNPEIIVEIGSHTDNKGTKGYNLKLSQQRAESVVKYLRSKGIDKSRLQAKGYGMAKPIAENQKKDGSDNPEGRAKNRRTEFKIIGKIEVSEADDWD